MTYFVVVGAWTLLWGTWLVLARRNKQVQTSAGARFMSLHMLLLGSALTLGIVRYRLLPQRILPWATWLPWLGAAVVCVGVAFALWARFYLGTNWSGTPTIKVEHELVTRGPYALARHPIYSGIWLGLLGSAISFGDVQGLVALVLASIAYARKIPVEERQLRAHFGDAYAEYARHVRALVPFVV